MNANIVYACVCVCVCVWGVWVCGPALTQVCVRKCDTVWLSVHMGEQGWGGGSGKVSGPRWAGPNVSAPRFNSLSRLRTNMNWGAVGEGVPSRTSGVSLEGAGCLAFLVPQVS